MVHLLQNSFLFKLPRSESCLKTLWESGKFSPDPTMFRYLSEPYLTTWAMSLNLSSTNIPNLNQFKIWLLHRVLRLIKLCLPFFIFLPCFQVSLNFEETLRLQIRQAFRIILSQTNPAFYVSAVQIF